MIIKKWFGLCILACVIVCLVATGVVGACNQTHVVTHSNQSLTNSDYNITVTETCTEEYNNTSFFGILITLLFFVAAIIVALFVSKAVWVKTVCTVGLSIMIMSITRFLSWFVSITNPAETELINTLDHFYMFGVWGFRLVTIAAMFVLLIIIINSIRDRPKKQWEDSWSNWGK